MYWLEFAAGALTMSGVSAGIGVIAYTVKTRGWSYFTSLKFIGRKPERKPLSLEMRLELGSDMEMAEWDEEFRKLATPKRDPELVAYVEGGGGAAAWSAWVKARESAEGHCRSCEYEDMHTYADQYVRRMKTWACPDCRKRERKQAERDAREVINRMHFGA